MHDSSQANSEKVVLIIDDSATIRRLVDSELSAAGYMVVTAPNAEDGIEKAASEKPDLVLLDHQLPGTTGYDVCTQLVASEQTRHLPVVISSTLRNKAYAEYVDLPNVVDMLPKPYTPELLIMTVKNALETGAMILNSQSNGSAVPEVIEQQNQATLSGSIGMFGVREILDLLNNGDKSGSLEIESNRYRIWIFVRDGRIQAATASGIDPSEVVQHIPASLSEVTPIMKFTVGGRRCSEIDGIVELLNNKVLDPRLLKQLLRKQAAYLVSLCFSEPPHSFRFEQDCEPPPLFRKLPLDTSLAALLVEGATLNAPNNDAVDLRKRFTRCAIRGQNLDRTGLSGKHIKLLGSLNEPRSIGEMVDLLEWTASEVHAAITGFQLGDLVKEAPVETPKRVYAIAQDTEVARNMTQFFANHKEKVIGKAVRDWIAIRLLLRKQAPDVIVVSLDQNSSDEVQSIKNDASLQSGDTKWIALRGQNTHEGFDHQDQHTLSVFDAVVEADNENEILACLEGLTLAPAC